MHKHIHPTKILIVDDEPVVCKTITEILHNYCGFRTATAGDGRTAMEKLRNEHFDIVITDLIMPEMDGLQLLASAQKEFQNIDFLVMTGYSGTYSYSQIINAGASDFITKPFMYEELIAKVERIVRERGLIKSLREEVTQRRKIQEELETLSERLERIVQERTGSLRLYMDIFHNIQSGIHVYRHDGRKDEERVFRLIEANSAASRITGRQDSEMLGRPLAENFPPLQEADVNRTLAEIIRTQTPCNIGEIHYSDPGVRDGWFSLKAFPLPGECVGVAFDDITEAKQAEMEKEELQQHLLQTQKMEALGTLAGGIAHDFNNILGTIVGNTEMVMDELEINSMPHQDLQRILKASLRAKLLVKQILSFSRKTKPERFPLKLSTVLQETLGLIRASIPSTIEIRLEVSATKPKILSDPTQLHQVLLNLSANAAHAMREAGGILDIRVSEETFTLKTRPHLSLRPGRYIKLFVRDTGHGMDEETMAHIFEPFYTTKEVGQGTGMGLAMVYGIMQSHEGAITVESRPGEGSTFSLYFPIYEGPDAEWVRPGAVVTPVRPTWRRKILVVDDEPELCELLSRILEKMGHEPTTTNDGHAALEMFRKSPHDFDLVLSDQTMPHMTGEQLAQELLTLRPDLPVILCTGYDQNLTYEKASAIGARNLLFKPISRQELRDAIEGCFPMDEAKG